MLDLPIITALATLRPAIGKRRSRLTHNLWQEHKTQMGPSVTWLQLLGATAKIRHWLHCPCGHEMSISGNVDGKVEEAQSWWWWWWGGGERPQAGQSSGAELKPHKIALQCTHMHNCTNVHMDNGTLEQLHRAHDLVVDLYSIVHRCSHCVVGSSLLHRYIGCSLCIVSSVGCSLLYAWLYGWSCMVGYSSLLGRILVFPAIFSHRHCWELQLGDYQALVDFRRDDKWQEWWQWWWQW